ncbi:unnamed protein product [Periconia digitata]|uniref:PLC-like phosphodiesterase n=1 Tax=Periconia digitata TaxID=1303443 RepID=A0A9W4XG57_9PLEO|nr:unnamed protein product [Periconia digitata]
MPSKGIICFSYNTIPDLSITFSVPGKTITKRSTHEHTIDHLEVESSALPRFKFSGEFSFSVQTTTNNNNEKKLTKQSVLVNTLTGALESGTMKTMSETHSIFTTTNENNQPKEVVITFIFYDAGPGLAHLPKQHHCSVTTTLNHSSWMTLTIPSSSPLSSRPFKKMVLPSAHDVGMNTMSSATHLLSRSGTGAIKEILGRSLPHGLDLVNRLSDKAVARFAPDIVRALAVTQKDSVLDLLRIGARYFEFRPARCHGRLLAWAPTDADVGKRGGEAFDDTIYFQHGAIPGMKYQDFLEEVVRFLAENKGEIVVVQNRWDGVPGECARPSGEELQRVLDDVLKGKEDTLKAGGIDDVLNKSVQQLRDEKMRLLVCQNVRQVSNYDDDANATLDGGSMVDKLEKMAEEPPKGFPLTLLQCQATPTNIRDVVIASVVDCDVSTSPLLVSKAVCDAKILPLLGGNVGKKLMEGLGDDGLVAINNDFLDGATVELAMKLCRERMS